MNWIYCIHQPPTTPTSENDYVASRGRSTLTNHLVQSFHPPRLLNKYFEYSKKYGLALRIQNIDWQYEVGPVRSTYLLTTNGHSFPLIVDVELHIQVYHVKRTVIHFLLKLQEQSSPIQTEFHPVLLTEIRFFALRTKVPRKLMKYLFNRDFSTYLIPNSDSSFCSLCRLKLFRSQLSFICVKSGFANFFAHLEPSRGGPTTTCVNSQKYLVFN